jgi:catechol 2,3-dioxygenase-like lactoylglutathione lyase family enzyme
MPVGEEETARRFYSGLLGMTEILKPPELAKRGGWWFESGSVQLHLGVEAEFHPAKKAHPAFRCGEYDVLVSRLREAGVEVTDAKDIPGIRRCHVHDPFGNRIELIGSEFEVGAQVLGGTILLFRKTLSRAGCSRRSESVA